MILGIIANPRWKKKSSDLLLNITETYWQTFTIKLENKYPSTHGQISNEHDLTNQFLFI